jgi:hypothetical protein
MACNGPDGSKWATDSCAATSAQTSCSESTGETCYYAFCLDSFGKVAWFSGKFLAGQGLKIHEPAALADLGIGPGDWVNKINGVLLSDEATLLDELAPFTEAAPASIASATHLLGKFQLALQH